MSGEISEEERLQGACDAAKMAVRQYAADLAEVRAQLVKAESRGWDAAVHEARGMGKVENESWFFDALAARNPHRRARP